MSKNTKNLTVKFIVDSAKAEARLRKAASYIKGVEEASKKATKGTVAMTTSTSSLNKTMGPLSATIGGASYRMSAFVRVIQSIPGPMKAAVAVIVSLGFAMKKTFEVANKAEGAIATMIALTGSETKAYKLLGQAVASSRTTPFTPLQEIGAAGKLIQYGMFDPFVKGLDSVDKAGKKVKISQMDVFEALGSFTDMKGDRIGLDRTIQGIMSGRKKMTRAFFRVIQDAWEATKEVTTVGSRSWGRILVKNIAKNFGKVNDLALMQSLTMKGMFSTIQGYGQEMWLAFSGVTQGGGLTLWTELKKIVFDIRNGLGLFAKTISPLLTSLGEAIGVFLTSWWNKIRALWAIFKGPIKVVFYVLIGVIQVLLELFSGISRILWKVIEGVGGLIGKFLKWTGILQFGKDIIASIIYMTTELVGGLEVFFLFLGEAISGFFEDIGNWLERLPNMVKGVIDKIHAYAVKKWKPLGYLIKAIDPFYHKEGRLTPKLKAAFNAKLSEEDKLKYGTIKSNQAGSNIDNSKTTTTKTSVDNSKTEYIMMDIMDMTNDNTDLTGANSVLKQEF